MLFGIRLLRLLRVAINVDPAEAFVLGASILLHDAAMSLAAYPGGLAEVRTTVAWKDAIARLSIGLRGNRQARSLMSRTRRTRSCNVSYQMFSADCMQSAPERLAEQAWRTADGSQVYLVEDSELRRFYGPTIGQVAHSHWWSVQKLEQEFSEDLGTLASRTLNRVDRVKLACLLRVADALHLDSRRAPRFLRAIRN